MHNLDAIHSLKTDEIDFAGRPMRVLRINDAIALRLDDVLLLMERADMSDVALMDYLAHTRISHDSPLPSIETLLHAFIPGVAVLHTQPDAVLALTHTPAGEAAVRACFGDEVIVVPHQPTCLQLAKAASAAVQASPNARGLVLMQRGLVTWGATPQEAHDRHNELATRAKMYLQHALEEHLAQHPASNAFAGFDISSDSYAARREIALKITPILRGLLSKDQRVVLRYDNTTDVLMFLAQPEAHTLLRDIALWLDLPSFWEGSGVGSDEVVRAHLEQHLAAADAMPHIIVMPNVGMWAAGADLREVTRLAETARRIFGIMSEARWVGGFVSHGKNDVLCEWLMPQQAPAEHELSRRIALVTGAANGIGKAIALRLAAEGAHVVVTDIDLANAQVVADEIVAVNGAGRAMALALDVTNEQQVQHVFDETVLRHGGLDVLVSNAGIAKVAAIADLTLKDWNLSLAINTTGHFLVSRAAMRVLLAQNIGGSLVFNATKNVTAPGKDFGAYSAAKAAEAQLCRILAIEGGPAHIRANMVNPDAVLSSNLWSPEIREKRARAQGIPVEQLEDFYTQRNLLKAKITGEDVAEAVFWLASDRSSKTTGAMIPVDGGVREAFPR